VTRHLLLGFLIVVTPLLGQQPASPNDAGSSAAHPSGIAQSPQKPQHPRKDVATIARETKGAVVSIVMADKRGQPLAQGSGFVVSRDGRIVTNYHVIKSGSSAVIKLPDGAFFTVDGVLAFDKDRDVAVIKAHGNNFQTVALGNSDRLQVGEEVVAIGSPLSLESTVSNGIVSGIRNEAPPSNGSLLDQVAAEGRKLLQITAPISHGSSGGPLFNMAGEVVGITSAAFVDGENLNFAVPINDAKRLLQLPAHALLAFPDAPEKEPEKIAEKPDAVGQDPIIFREWRADHGATGFAEAFATEPACRGLTLLDYDDLPKGIGDHWGLTVYKMNGTAAGSPLLHWDDLYHVNCPVKGQSCSDLNNFDIYALLREKFDASNYCSPNCTTQAALSAGVKAVCTLVKGGGGQVPVQQPATGQAPTATFETRQDDATLCRDSIRARVEQFSKLAFLHDGQHSWEYDSRFDSATPNVNTKCMIWFHVTSLEPMTIPGNGWKQTAIRLWDEVECLPLLRVPGVLGFIPAESEILFIDRGRDTEVSRTFKCSVDSRINGDGGGGETTCQTWSQFKNLVTYSFRIPYTGHDPYRY
jgi:hypothetical protein